MGIFDFTQDLGNYESRKVGRSDFGLVSVSTARISDGKQPYETAIKHKEYRPDLKWIVVETYNTASEARAGHDKWVAIMTTEPLPKVLVDCANAEIAELIGKQTFKRVKARRRE